MSTPTGNGHGQGTSHDNTEGDRQYYPSGWYIPLAGLVATVFGLICLAAYFMEFSGTDRWGKSKSAGHGHAQEQHIESHDKQPAQDHGHEGKGH
ncbi:MAG TPA: hypothetical protein VI731_11850 [Bacteroidia bacterium]|nr:hypothetical protein [Bacteroidia bacterium]